MFDVGFSELIVIGVVALVVIGPERLPKVARTLGVLVGRMQRYVAQVKSDINREMELADLGKVKEEFESAARSFRTDVEAKAAEVQGEIRDVQAEIDRELASHAAQVQAPVESAAAPAAESQSPPPSPQLELGIDEPPSAPPRDRPAG